MYCVCLGIGVEGGDVSCGGARLREQSAQRESDEREKGRDADFRQGDR